MRMLDQAGGAWKAGAAARVVLDVERYRGWPNFETYLAADELSHIGAHQIALWSRAPLGLEHELRIYAQRKLHVDDTLAGAFQSAAFDRVDFEQIAKRLAPRIIPRSARCRLRLR